MTKLFQKETVLVVVILLALAFFFSYRLLRVPPGINIDESSIGYNATLIVKTGHDENNRLLPIFILTLEGKDWKQPVTIYLTALLFKLFGSSYYLLRFVSVLFALASCSLFYLLLRMFFSVFRSVLGLVLFAFTPQIIIQSHLALENIALLPFIIAWLICLFFSVRKNKPIFLVLSGICLGISFYSYKGMHALTPVYAALSLGYLLFASANTRSFIRNSLIFTGSVLPFLLPLNWLQIHYAGAIYDPQTIGLPSLDVAVYRYLTAFDFSFLFVRGDKMLVHSTGRFGMFLLPVLPLFFLGITKLIKKPKHEFLFILVCLLATPIPLVTIDSVYRASRLMPFVPLVLFIVVLGIEEIFAIKLRNKRLLISIPFLLWVSITALFFIRVYWYDYPKLISGDFSPNINAAMKELQLVSRQTNKTPMVEDADYRHYLSGFQFYEQVYFSQPLSHYLRSDVLPSDAVLLTTIDSPSNQLTTIPSLESGQKSFYIISGEYDKK